MAVKMHLSLSTENEEFYYNVFSKIMKNFLVKPFPLTKHKKSGDFTTLSAVKTKSFTKKFRQTEKDPV